MIRSGRLAAATAVILAVAMGLAGCGQSILSANDGKMLTGKRFAIVVKSAGNENMKKMTDGFSHVIEAAGGTVIIKEPSYATNDQTELVSSLISQNVSGISISVNDPAALKDLLKEARDKNIGISAFDSPAAGDTRDIFINQADAVQIGEALAEAVYDLTGGEGQWAILSSTSVAPNQSAWIDALKEVLERDSKYSQLTLVDVAYGNDDPEKSGEETRRLLRSYPDLEVICSPTTIGMLAAAEVLSGEDSGVQLTGLGLPQEMEPYLGNVCPYMFFWDTYALGELTAYAALGLESGTFKGAEGEELDAGELGTFSVIRGSDGGTEIILGPLEKIEPGDAGAEVSAEEVSTKEVSAEEASME